MTAATTYLPPAPRTVRGPWLSPAAATFGLVWLLLMTVGPWRLFRDPGTFWHTAVGGRICQEGFFRTDPYSFTRGGEHWIPHQWLGEVLMYWLYRSGSFDGQLLVAATLLATLAAILMARLTATGLHPAVAAVILAVGLLAAGSHFHIRPHLATLAGTLLLSCILCDVEAGHASLWRLAWLPPLIAGWSNLHGGALGGIFTVGLVIAGWLVAWRLGCPSPVRHWRQGAGVLAVLAAAGAAPLLNPYGLELLTAWRSILGEPILKEIIEEHRPLEWGSLVGRAATVLMISYLIMIVGIPLRRWSVLLVVPLVWFVQAVDRCRHVSLFVVVTIPILAAAWPQCRWATWLSHRRPDLYDPQRVRRWPWRAHLVVPLTLLAAAAVCQFLKWPVPVIGHDWASPPAQEWPIELLPLMRAHEPPAERPARLFNDLKYGGFVILFVPGYKVFVDDRCELYGGPWLAEYAAASRDPAAAARAIESWQQLYGPFDFALVQADTPFDGYFAQRPQQWEQLGECPMVRFYRWRAVSNAKE